MQEKLYIILIGFGAFILAMSFVKFRKTINKNKKNKGLGVIYGICFAVAIILARLFFIPAINGVGQHHTENSEYSQKSDYTNDTIAEESDNVLYFIETYSLGIRIDVKHPETKISKCVFVETGLTSCDVRCVDTHIETRQETAGLMEKIQCPEGIKQSQHNDKIIISDTHYSERNNTCTHDTTIYKRDNYDYHTKEYRHTSCRLLKKSVLEKGRFWYTDGPSNLGFSVLMRERDYNEFIKTKLREISEFKRLYEKYRDR